MQPTITLTKMIRNPAEDGKHIGRLPEHNVGYAEERRCPTGASAFFYAHSSAFSSGPTFSHVAICRPLHPPKCSNAQLPTCSTVRSFYCQLAHLPNCPLAQQTVRSTAHLCYSWVRFSRWSITRFALPMNRSRDWGLTSLTLARIVVIR